MRLPQSQLSLSEVDQRALEYELGVGEIKEAFGSPALQHLVARIKQVLVLKQEQFFDPSHGIPVGLKEASNREAYFVGLAMGGKVVLGLVEEMRQEGSRPEPQPEKKVMDQFNFSNGVAK